MSTVFLNIYWFMVCPSLRPSLKQCWCPGQDKAIHILPQTLPPQSDGIHGSILRCSNSVWRIPSKPPTSQLQYQANNQSIEVMKTMYANRDRIPLHLFIIYASGNAALNGLNLLWFSKMVRQMIVKLQGGAKKEVRKEQKIKVIPSSPVVAPRDLWFLSWNMKNAFEPMWSVGAWIGRPSCISGNATDSGGKGTRCLWRREELMHADRLYWWLTREATGETRHGGPSSYCIKVQWIKKVCVHSHSTCLYSLPS